MFELNPSLMAFNGRRFNSVELDGEFWIRTDELGLAIGLEQPEQAVLDLYHNHPGQFSERLTALAGVETPEGARLMRVFNLLGAYVLCTFVDTCAARAVRRWLLETIIYFQMDVKREIRRLIEEHKLLREMIDALRADVDALKAAAREQAAGAKGEAKPDWVEGEFRRLFEEQMAAFRDTLAAVIREHLARLPAAPGVGREGMEGLAEAIAGLCERIGGAAPNAPISATPEGMRVFPGFETLAVPNHHYLRFDYAGEPLMALVWNGNGPWLFAEDLLRLTGTPESALQGTNEWIEARVAPRHRTTIFNEGSGKLFAAVNLDGADEIFAATGWTSLAQALRRWLRDTLEPSLDALAMREDQMRLAAGAEPLCHHPEAPTRIVASKPFPVYAGEIGGRPCHLVYADGLRAFLGNRLELKDWFAERRQRHGWQRDEDYLQILTPEGRCQAYISLDAALALLFQERSPKAVEAYGYLLGVAQDRERAIEGEARVVREDEAEENSAGGLVPVPFRGATLFVVDHSGEPYVPMRPVVEGMGLSWASQTVKLNANKARWGITEIVIPSGSTVATIETVVGDGKERKMLCLPLRKIVGWLMTISPNKVKPEIKGKIIAYQQECDDVLWQYWNNEKQPQRGTTQPARTHWAASLPDTPPAAPLQFDFEGKALRMAVRDGEPWLPVADLAAALGEPLGETLSLSNQAPPEWRALLPSPAGEQGLPALNEQGLAFFFGGRGASEGGEARRRLRDFLARQALPALREQARRRQAQAEAPAPQALPPVPPEKLYTLTDPVCVAFASLVQARMRSAGRGQGAYAAPARLLAWLWRNGPGGLWLEAGDEASQSQLAKALQTSRRSLNRAMECLSAWQFVECDPAIEPEDAGSRGGRRHPFVLPGCAHARPRYVWPDRMRLLPDNLRAALAEAGLGLPKAAGAAR